MAAIVSRLTTAARSLENADRQTIRQTIRRTDSDERAGESKNSYARNKIIEESLHPFSMSSVTLDERGGCRGVNTLKRETGDDNVTSI